MQKAMCQAVIDAQTARLRLEKPDDITAIFQVAVKLLNTYETGDVKPDLARSMGWATASALYSVSICMGKGTLLLQEKKNETNNLYTLLPPTLAAAR